MKKPWKAAADTLRQGQNQKPSQTRSQSEGRSLKDSISGPVRIATPIDAGIPMEKESNIVEDDAPSSTRDDETKPNTPSGHTPDDQRVTNAVWPSGASQQPVRVAQQHNEEEPPVENGTAVRFRGGTPSSGAHARQPSKNVRMSYFSTDSNNNSNSEPKKKSAFRGAMGKLFGRRKKTISQASTLGPGSTRPTPEPAHHQGDGADEGVFEAANPQHKRSVSVPVSEKDRALRSHSVGAKDRLAIESAREFRKAESSFSRQRPGTQSLRGPERRSVELTGLSPRPVRQSDGTSKVTTCVEDDSEIGRAVSGDHTESKGLNRRSRSLSALPLGESENIRDLGRTSDFQSRDFVYKSPGLTATEDERDHSAELERDILEIKETPIKLFPLTEAGAAGGDRTASAHLDDRVHELEARTQYLLGRVTSLERALKSVEGGQASPKSLPRIQPIDEYLDGALPRSQSQDKGTPQQFQTPQRPEDKLLRGMASRGLSQDNRISPRGQSHSRQAEGNLDGELTETPLQDAQSTVAEAGSAKDKSKQGANAVPPVPLLPSTPEREAAKRPDSTATIKGASSLPPAAKHTPEGLTTDHYNTFIGLLNTERDARRALEAQVKALDHQLRIMRTQLPPTNGLGHSSLAFGGGSAFDDDSEDSEPKSWKKKAKTSPYQDTDEHSAAYATPREPDTTDDEAMGYKKSNRTLSLSQMTMQPPKKKATTSQNPEPSQ